MVQVRVAKISDAVQMLDIYTPYILDSAFTFETEVHTEADFQQRIMKNL